VNAAPAPPSESSWTHWYRRSLPAYWVFLFCVTHFPELELGGPVPSPDKLAHVAAFGLLAFLFWRFAETFARPLSARFVWIAGFWLALYAGFDEYLQRFVGRNPSLIDWLCNVCGMAIILGLLEWRRRRQTAKS
jgi:VanZ family protein